MASEFKFEKMWFYMKYKVKNRNCDEYLCPLTVLELQYCCKFLMK